MVEWLVEKQLHLDVRVRAQTSYLLGQGQNSGNRFAC